MNCDEMRRELQRTLEGVSELPRNRCKDARRIIEYGGGEGTFHSLCVLRLLVGWTTTILLFLFPPGTQIFIGPTSKL